MSQYVKVQIALFITVVFWASAFIGIRIGLTEYTPGALALLRFLIASCSMSILYYLIPKAEISLRDKLGMIGLGVLGIGVYHIFLNYGEIQVTAGIASFIIGLMPVFSIILSVLYLKERVSKGVWVGVVISFVGLLLMMLSESQAASLTISAVAILIAAIMGAVQSVFQKPYLCRYHPIVVTTWIFWGGTLSMSIFSLDLIKAIPHTTLTANMAATYLGLFPATLAYLAWCYVVEHMSVAKASLYLYFMPIISTLLGLIWLHERPTTTSLLGGLIALLGAVFSHRMGSYPIDAENQEYQLKSDGYAPLKD